MKRTTYWRLRRFTMELRNFVIKIVLVGKLLHLAQVSPVTPAVEWAVEVCFSISSGAPKQSATIGQSVERACSWEGKVSPVLYSHVRLRFHVPLGFSCIGGPESPPGMGEGG